MMKVPEATKKGFCEIFRGGWVDLTQLNSKTRRGRKMVEKANCLTTEMNFYQYIGKADEMVKGCALRGRYTEDGEKTFQNLEIRDDDKSNAVTTVQKDCLVCEDVDTTKPVRIGNIGKTTAHANRVYSVKGKSVCLQSQAGGGGAKTWLYKIDLPDGDYLIRKLTPIEAERLQTLPDNYTEGISDTQRYKCIGNGWTVDVIAHLLSGLKQGAKMNEIRQEHQMTVEEWFLEQGENPIKR